MASVLVLYVFFKVGYWKDYGASRVVLGGNVRAFGKAGEDLATGVIVWENVFGGNGYRVDGTFTIFFTE